MPAPRGVLVGEPTRLRLANQHKGSYTCAVDVTGRAAHASLREHGASATALAPRMMIWIDDQSARAHGPSAWRPATTWQGSSAVFWLKPTGGWRRRGNGHRNPAGYYSNGFNE
ncbi:hypothetical protein AAFO92_14025 [Roseovarius sp. CAU 1744]|uniref:hypothetical protein n=1 Tax=Roseovarius sp. CAU 1744 TaxID=3140368 RepID=UPI00325B6593